MMHCKVFAAAVLLGCFAACGGGSGSQSSGESGSDNATPSSRGLQDNLGVATALATEAHASIKAAGQVPEAMGTAQLTSLVNRVGAGTLVDGKLTAACALGGSVSADFPVALTSWTTGKTYTLIFTNCEQMAGVVSNGLISLSFSSLVNSNNFVETATYSITVMQANGSITTYAGRQSCTAIAGAVSCSFSDGQRSFGANFSNASGTLNGSYGWTHGGGQNINFDFSNWSTSGGTLNVNGPDKFRATVVRDGPNSYTITINGGAPRPVTVPG
jgi:hypothetical protein